jgi:hypothetical protein
MLPLFSSVFQSAIIITPHPIFNHQSTIINKKSPSLRRGFLTTHF